MKYVLFFDVFLRRKLKEVKRTFRFNDQVFKALRSSQIKVSFNKAWVTYKFKTIVGDIQENPEISQIIIVLAEAIVLIFYVVSTVLLTSTCFFAHFLKTGKLKN